MKTKILVAPSILSANQNNLAGEAKMMEKAGADFLHVDVMDGRFVPRVNYSPHTVKLLSKATKLPLDVHLMVFEPWKLVKEYAKAGAKRICVHAEAGNAEEVPFEAMIDREPLTVICSKMGWIRALKGHAALDAEVKFKDGDEARFAFHAETTDKILALGSNGRFYTVIGANLPGGRGMGEPLRLMVDLPNDAEIVDLMIFRPGERLLIASTAGDGFIVPSDEIVAQNPRRQTSDDPWRRHKNRPLPENLR